MRRGKFSRTLSPMKINENKVNKKKIHHMEYPSSQQDSKAWVKRYTPPIQWNPVNMTTFGPWKIGRINRLVVLKKFF